jgi:inner membrane protein
VSRADGKHLTVDSEYPLPLTSTHALVPIAVALALGPKPFPRKLIAWSVIAAAAPDVDALTNPIWADRWGLSTFSIYAHRGATHSLFIALAAGLIAALFHKSLRVGRLTAAVSIGAAMASHGLLDMMTDSGRPVAYLWPLSSARLFADWRPLHSSPIAWAHIGSQFASRMHSELIQLILPMFAVAAGIRLLRRWGVA